MTNGSGASRPRVFVSSVVDGFREYREAARKGITAAGGDPVLVNEDFPSQPTSSRNACFDAINSCDYVVSIVGERGGWKAPSGHLVVEEEFEHARQRNRVVLAFIQDTARDADAERYAGHLSHYVDGEFRTTFKTPDELERLVEQAVRDRVNILPTSSVVERDLSSYFSAPRNEYSTMAMIRLVVVPDREEEVVDPVRIASPELLEQIYQIGHASSVKLFSYSRPKSARLDGAALVIDQTEPNGRHGEGEYVRVRLEESGVLTVDANVTGRIRRGNQSNMIDSMVVALEDVEGALSSAFRFVLDLYEFLDPYKRHERFHFNVGLRHLGHRKVERNPQPRSQMAMSMRGSDPVTAYDHSRVISRAALRDPRLETERAVALLVRRAGE